MIPAVLLVLLLLTGGVLVSGAVMVARWSPPRQVLSELTARGSCGLADDISIPNLASIRQLAPAMTATEHTAPPGRTLLRTPKTGDDVWYRVPGGPVGVFLGGTWKPRDQLLVTWGAKKTGHGVRRLTSGPANLYESPSFPDPVARHFVAEFRLPERPPNANVVALRVGTRSSRTARLTSPVAYREVDLAAFLNERRNTALVSPSLFAAMPCARLPRLSHGTAGVPNLVIEAPSLPSMTIMTSRTSPFVGLRETMDVWRVPLRARWTGWGEYVRVYTVRIDPRDSIAPPMVRTAA